MIAGVGYGTRMFAELSNQPSGSETGEVVARRARRVAILTRVLAILLVSATVLMAIARYV
jgi:hypothetical protein